jgi:hypothetical protein
MTDALVPDWIREMDESDRRAATEVELRKQRDMATAKTLKADSPEFWEQLVKEIRIATDALPKIGIQAAVTCEDTLGRSYCINLTYLKGRVASATTVLEYGGGSIRYYDQQGNTNHIELGVDSRTWEIVGVMDDRSKPPMGAPDLARSIVEPMVVYLRRFAM